MEYVAMATKTRGKGKEAPIRFQYKGLFPAIDEAARVSFVYRHKLAHLVTEVACSACGGSRLRARVSESFWRAVSAKRPAG